MFRKKRKGERRRLTPRRLQLNPQVFVSVDESRTDLLFDLGEGGLSVYGLMPKKQHETFNVAFDLPGGGSIKASAATAWTSAAKNRTGIRFLNITDESRQRLADWMSNRFYTALPARSRRKFEPIPFLQPVDTSVTLPFQEIRDELASRLEVPSIAKSSIHEPRLPKLLHSEVAASRQPGNLRLALGILAAVALLSLSVGLLRSYLSRRAEIRKDGKPTVTAIPEAPFQDSTQSVRPSVPFWPAPVSRDVPGFVLQVGAMKNEANADGLSSTLKRRNLPAFVFKHSTDPFYRVAVGPYSDMSSAKRVKDELQREKVEAILRRWIPE